MRIVLPLVTSIIFLLTLSSCTKEIDDKKLETRGGIQYEKNESEAFTGKASQYFSNDNLKSVVSYKNGRRDGLDEVWYKNGQKKSEESYKEGKLDGALFHWHENGKRHEESSYKNNKLHGLKTIWDLEGYIIYKGNYKNGSRID